MKAKPCPFCSADNVECEEVRTIHYNRNNGKDQFVRTYAVVCHECNTIGPVTLTYADAIELWSSRYESQKET